MKPIVLTLAVLGLAAASDAAPSWFAAPAVQSRIGFDSNPVAAGGATVPVLGDRDAFTAAAGWSFGASLPEDAIAGLTAKLAYNGEANHFDHWTSEDFTTHKLALTAKLALGAWALSTDASALYIDGDRDTLPSLSGSSAQATSVWRERRAQLQYRAKLLAVRDLGPATLRLHGSLLSYDYLTHVVAGLVAFADRADFMTGADLGRKTASQSLAFVGVRAGRQYQDQVPLPGVAFDYSSTYTRLVAGWEGRLDAATTLAFAAGPDFHHYDGAVDTRVFPGRDRTALWLEASATRTLGKTSKWTFKATRWTWLSSTGKSAYIDLSMETALAVSLSAHDTLRLTAKAHQTNYTPIVRNDWEGLAGLGWTRKLSAALSVTADCALHRGWNGLSDVPDRAFSRTFASLGASYQF